MKEKKKERKKERKKESKKEKNKIEIFVFDLPDCDEK